MMDGWKWRRNEEARPGEPPEAETQVEEKETIAEEADSEQPHTSPEEAPEPPHEKTQEEAACLTQLQATQEALKQAEGRCLRALAEMENVRRRAAKEKEDAIKFGNASLAKDLLAFVDNLERALQCAPHRGSETSDVQAFVQGVQLVAKDVVTTLERHGICKIASNGQPFNPEFHQAVAEVPAEEGPKGIIKETLQTGYTIHGRLLRAAMVVVTK